ncbi:endonuclease [Kitasatospora sp. NPDC059646]|uniref:endonuclease n=1 Tax=Kitasatospora sp. NPDC059646 TaxID=3346893 RepID=UPI0036931DB6
MSAVDDLLEEHGTTYAEQAGIRLRDTPSPLYRLLVLTQLCAIRIRADTAVAAARELSAAGWRTPDAMARSTWQQRVDALGRAHYVRYDESTATALGEAADLVRERWRGDLRRLREEAGGAPAAIGRLLQEVPRIGPVGADIFRREAQLPWPELRPFFDRRALGAAARLGLPETPDGLAELVPAHDLARLSTALVRAALAG